MTEEQAPSQSPPQSSESRERSTDRSVARFVIPLIVLTLGFVCSTGEFWLWIILTISRWTFGLTPQP